MSMRRARVSERGAITQESLLSGLPRRGALLLMLAAGMCHEAKPQELDSIHLRSGVAEGVTASAFSEVDSTHIRGLRCCGTSH